MSDQMFMGRFSCVDTYPDQVLRSTYNGGYEWDCGDGWFSMHFDPHGNYTHQYQEGIYGLQRIVKGGVDPLTAGQMNAAKDGPVYPTPIEETKDETRAD